MNIPSMSYEPTEEMRKAFDYFLQREYSEISRPKFQNESDRDSAIRVWWATEVQRRHCQKKINNFRLAFYDLTGIG